MFNISIVPESYQLFYINAKIIAILLMIFWRKTVSNEFQTAIEHKIEHEIDVRQHSQTISRSADVYTQLQSLVWTFYDMIIRQGYWYSSHLIPIFLYNVRFIAPLENTVHFSNWYTLRRNSIILRGQRLLQPRLQLLPITIVCVYAIFPSLSFWLETSHQTLHFTQNVNWLLFTN